MTEKLNKPTVLVLNRNWQAINVRTPADAFCQLAAGVVSALDIGMDKDIRPVSWDDWICLPIGDQDDAIQTVRGPVRIPTVIVVSTYAQVPKRRPRFCAKTIRERDENRCQYSGKVLRPEEGSIDHVLPRSRGGEDTWENCVWASKKINGQKGNRLPKEAGLKLLAVPRMPKELPVTVLIRNSHGVPEWKLFLPE